MRCATQDVGKGMRRGTAVPEPTEHRGFWDDVWQGVQPPQPTGRRAGRLRGTRREVLACLDRYFSRSPVAFLEAGCGVGEVNLLVGQHRSGVISLGVDLSKSVWTADRRRRRDGCRSVFFCQGDLFAIPVKSASFDLVASLGVIEHFEDSQPLLREFARVLKPGGILFVSTPNRNSLYALHRRDAPYEILEQYFTPAQLADRVGRAGFVVREAFSRYFALSVSHTMSSLVPYDKSRWLSRVVTAVVERVGTPVLEVLDPLLARWGFHTFVIAEREAA